MKIYEKTRKSAFFKWWITCVSWHDAVQDHFLWLRFHSECKCAGGGRDPLPVPTSEFRGLKLVKKLDKIQSQERSFLRNQIHWFGLWGLKKTIQWVWKKCRAVTSNGDKDISLIVIRIKNQMQTSFLFHCTGNKYPCITEEFVLS